MKGLTKLQRAGFQIEFHWHADAILEVDFPSAINELSSVLGRLQIPLESLVRGGGGEHPSTRWLRTELGKLHWKKHHFKLKKLVDDEPREIVTHIIDHVRKFDKGTIALEIEWNNKDPFFDRDLENFKRLHMETAISIGIVITRGESFQSHIREFIYTFARSNSIRSFDDLSPYDLEPTSRQKRNTEKIASAKGLAFPEAWAEAFCDDKYGESTTHWRKLQEKVSRGIGAPCPFVLIGIPIGVIAK